VDTIKWSNFTLVAFIFIAVTLMSHRVCSGPNEEPNNGRQHHTATLLQNDKVLIVGGWNGSNTLATAELYDPATGTWSQTGKMSSARRGHEATLLTDGKVLVTGGFDGNYFLSTAEIYDPTSGTWSLAGKMTGCTSS
jgi:hypothetical protein